MSGTAWTEPGKGATLGELESEAERSVLYGYLDRDDLEPIYRARVKCGSIRWGETIADLQLTGEPLTAEDVRRIAECKVACRVIFHIRMRLARRRGNSFYKDRSERKVVTFCGAPLTDHDVAWADRNRAAVYDDEMHGTVMYEPCLECALAADTIAGAGVHQ